MNFKEENSQDQGAKMSGTSEILLIIGKGVFNASPGEFY
jgi:hypothetical protein